MISISEAHKRECPLFLMRVIQDLDDLLDPLVRRELVTADSNAERVFQEGARQTTDRFGPCSGDCASAQAHCRTDSLLTHDRLALGILWTVRDDAADIILESLVEHSVGLIQYQVGDAESKQFILWRQSRFSPGKVEIT